MKRFFECISLSPLFLLIGACDLPGDDSATLGTSSGATSSDVSTDTSGGATSTTGSTGDTTTGNTTSGSTTTGSTTAGLTTGDTSSTDSTDTGDTSTGDTGDTTGDVPECVQHFGDGDTEFCYGDRILHAAVAGKSPLLAGDVDQDGHLDIIVPGAVDGILVFRGDGTGGLMPPLLTPYDPANAAAVGDFDADGWLDLAVGVPGVSPRIDLLLGDGTGAFVVEDSFPSGKTVAAYMATGDFDADGDLDVVAIHNGFADLVPKRLATVSSAGGQSWSYADQTLTFFSSDLSYDAWSPYLTTGMFDGEHLDVVVAQRRSVDQLHRLRSDGQGAFTYEGLFYPNSFLTGVMPLAVLDVDDDGDNDVLGASPFNSTIKYLNNQGGGTWSAPLTSDLASYAADQIAVGELIQGPRPDIVHRASNGMTMVSRIEVDGNVVSPGGLGFLLGVVRTFVLADLNEDGMSDFVSITMDEPIRLAVRLSE